MRVSDIVDNENNFRSHPENQREAFRKTVQTIGFYGYPDVYEIDGALKLIDGELRKHHLIKQYGPNTEIEVNVTDFDEREANIALATHDPLSGLATQDLSSSIELIDDSELAALMGEILDVKTVEDSINEEAEPKVELADELQEKWNVQSGQLWAIEGESKHRLVCGDSTSKETVARLLRNANPRLMVTDPPYGVNYDPAWREGSDLGVGDRSTGKVENDDKASWIEAYQMFGGDVAYVWHASLFTNVVADEIDLCGFERRCLIIWAKQHFAMSQGHYHWQHEPCWYAVRKGRSANWTGDRKQTSLWEIANNNAFGGDGETKWGHGTQKPIECMARPIRNHTRPGEAVYDPFLGSGTTMAAAEQLKRSCYGLELSERYCAVILERMTSLGCECKVL